MKYILILILIAFVTFIGYAGRMLITKPLTIKECQDCNTAGILGGGVSSGEAPNSYSISVENFDNWKVGETIFMDGVKFIITGNDESVAIDIDQIDDQDLSGRFQNGTPVTICHDRMAN